MPSRRLSGYDLDWLQTISLAGLQALARSHGVEDEAETVPELIELLAREEEDEDGEYEDSEKAEFYSVSSPVRGRPPTMSTNEEDDVSDAKDDTATDHEMIADHGEEEEEEKDDDDNNDNKKEDEKEDAKEEQAEPNDAAVVDVTDEIPAAAAPMPVPAPPPISVPSTSTRRALPRSEASGKIKPWSSSKSFLPKVAAKSAVVAAKPITVVTVVAPIGGGASGGEQSLHKALDSARSKKLEEEKKQQAAQARREAAQARRERILSAFKKTQANIQQQASEQPLKVVSSKAPAAWEVTAARATKQQHQPAAKSKVAAAAASKAC